MTPQYPDGFYQSEKNTVIYVNNMTDGTIEQFVPKTGEFSTMYDMALFTYCEDQEAMLKKYPIVDGWLYVRSEHSHIPITKR